MTELLAEASSGRGSAEAKLWSTIYNELRRLARGEMAGESPGLTLQTTALVHEAYFRLVGNGDVRWENRRHFFGAAARAMRQILVDEARRRHARKRGGDLQRIPLPRADAAIVYDLTELLDIDDVMGRLEAIDPRKAEIVHLRYFAGLTIDETAAAVGVSPRTVDSEWRFVRAWLHRELSENGIRG